ncbi:MAG: RNA polymerase sigma factor, partial [Syntrophothermus sp.]
MSSLALGTTLGYILLDTAGVKAEAGYSAAPAKSATDEDLVRQVVFFHNKDAFSDLVERYKGTIFNLIYRTIGSSSEAEDLAQEVFFQVYRSLPAFRNEARFSTWLYRIALNRCRDWIRGRRRRPQTLYLDETAD